MYPRNNATPPRLSIGQVIQISDGAVQSSGVTITLRGEGQAETTGGGTTAYGADGTVYYTPTQAETNYTAFVVIANKASCFSASITVVTTATAVSGTVDIGAVSGDATAADNLELDYDGTGYAKANSTIGTATDVSNGVTASTVTDKTGYSISGTKTTLDDLNDVSTAEVNTEVDLGLTDIGLDHLVNAAVTGTDVADNSIIAYMVSKSATADWDSFVNATDALEAIRDRGDSAWVTGSGGGGGGSAPTEAEIYTYFTASSREDAFKADVSALATAASIAALNDFNPATDTVANVTTVATTTTNSDMRGTDNAFLEASAPTNFGDLAITASTGRVTVGTNADKTGYSISGSITTLDGLNDPTAAAIADAVRSEMDSSSTQLAAIVADTNELQGDWVNGGRLDLILDSVLSLLDDARSEPGQGAPPVNPDAMTKLDYLYKAWRNKKTQTATTFSLFDDAGTTVDHKATVSDDGTTATIGEVATGP